MKYFGWIFLFFIMLYIVPLGSRPLLIPEFDHASIVREMVDNSSYDAVLIQRVAGPDIPPMAFWITSASYKLFGINSFAARLPSALATGITALLIALLLRQHLRDEKLAALAAMVFMSFSLVLLVGSLAVPPMIFIMAVTGTLGTLFLALQEPKYNRRKFLLSIIAGLFTALGFLTLGSGAWFFPAIIILPYMIFSKKFRDLLTVIPAWLIFAVLPVLPWIFKLAEDPALWNTFFSISSFKAGIGTYPWYTYLLNIVFGIFPILLLLPAAFIIGKDSWKRLWNQEICRFAIYSTLIPMLYFLIFRRSIGAVLLISFPSLAILTAMGLQAYFNNGGHHRSFDWMINFWALLLLIGGLAEVALWFMPEKVLEYFNILPFTQTVLLALGVASLIGGIVLLYSMKGNWRSRLYLFFFTVAILPLGISWCFRPNVTMPESNIRAFVENYDIKAGKNLIYTTTEMMPAAAWCTEKGTPVCNVYYFAEDIKKLRQPAYVILKHDDPFWQQYPQYKSMMINGNFACALYPAAANKGK